MYDSPQVEREHIDRLHQREGVLSCSKARYYNPNIGRFVSEDPLQGLTYSVFAYVGNRPIDIVDPSGRVAVDIGRLKIHRITWDDVRRACYPKSPMPMGKAYAPGCYIPNFFTDCVCSKVGCNAYKAKVTITAEPEIYSIDKREYIPTKGKWVEPVTVVRGELEHQAQFLGLVHNLKMAEKR